MIPFKLPSLGSDMDEGKLLEWNVKPGDVVKRGDVVAVVDTSKAAVDVESWEEGTVHELLVQPGETVPVGTVIATLLAPGETADMALALAPELLARPPAAPQPPPAATAARAAGGSRRPISPAARKRAAQLGVDLDAVRGSGPAGAVTVKDVEEAVAAAQPRDRAGDMRRAIAAAMARSKREIPHYYLSEPIPMQRALAWLQRENAHRPVTERVLPVALLLRAVALACLKFPDMNGFYNQGFHAGGAVHVGVAIALRQGGLVAPALHDVDRKTPMQLMGELADLVRRARAGSLRSSEMSDPTITVTNLGDGGVEGVFGVIYPPQVALVGFGRIGERPWVEDGVVRALPVVSATLAADHRVSDGHRGALFLAEIRDLLQHPEGLL